MKKIASLKLYVTHLKFRLLSEMVAKDYLVSFLCGNTALGFCDLINKYKQISAFFFFSRVGGRIGTIFLRVIQISVQDLSMM